eukprot:scaffold240_cov129-Isochrysis_galbana.AAC.3
MTGRLPQDVSIFESRFGRCSGRRCGGRLERAGEGGEKRVASLRLAMAPPGKGSFAWRVHIRAPQRGGMLHCQHACTPARQQDEAVVRHLEASPHTRYYRAVALGGWAHAGPGASADEVPLAPDNWYLVPGSPRARGHGAWRARHRLAVLPSI